jgi:hypothetical protein
VEQIILRGNFFGYLQGLSNLDRWMLWVRYVVGEMVEKILVQGERVE